MLCGRCESVFSVYAASLFGVERVGAKLLGTTGVVDGAKAGTEFVV